METRLESPEESNEKKTSRINTKLLPLKLHYFFQYGGIAAVIPYLPIVGKKIGINATYLGIGYSMIPIFTFLSNPVIGFLVDYFQNIKVFLIIFLILSSVAYASVICLPAINYEILGATYIRISQYNKTRALFNISKPFESICLEKILQNYTECKLVFNGENIVLTDNETTHLDDAMNVTYNVEQIETIDETQGTMHWTTFYIKDILLSESEDMTSLLNIQCSPSIHQCSINESHDIFSAYQFWLFFILVVFGSITGMAANSLTNVGCFELLGTNPDAYGRQRLFGTISWGLICPLSGLLNDHFKGSIFNRFSIVLLIAVFQTIDIVILCTLPLPKAHASSNMRRDLRIILTSKEIQVFSSGVVIIGFLNAIIYVFEFWFLEDMGASRTLLGLSIFMQCLVGEVPFLFFSGWFVNKLGHFLCFACVFVGFLLRLVFYSLLKNPWLVLPVDTLHGVTYGLFHGAMSSFAKQKAPKGMEATLLGLYGGLYEGLGYGLGSFLGGFGLDKLGPRQTFLCASGLSLGSFLSFILASYIFRRKLNKERFQANSLEIDEIGTNF